MQHKNTGKKLELRGDTEYLYSHSVSNKISLLATTLASRVFGLLGFCWFPEFGGATEIGTVVAVP